MNAVANVAMDPVANVDFASAICAEHDAAQASARDAVAHAIRAGELLIDAKASLKHGEFNAWLAANVTFSERTARGYMRLAGLDEAKRQRVADMSLRGALRSLSTPSNSSHGTLSRDQMARLSINELDDYRRRNLELAATHMQAILDSREIPEAADMPRALECVADCERMLVDIGVRSPRGQLPLALMLMEQCSDIRRMLAKAAP
jgi:hypothetical protein